MEVIKANFNNQKHRALYENFCKKNHIAIERTSTIQKDHQKDLKKASLHIDKKKDKKSKVKEIYILIKNCIDYLFATESAIDIILHVENSQISTLLEGLGYDILSLGEDDKGLYLYSIFKEPLEEE